MTGTELKQRLVAILAADAAGYSRLMSSDERGTVAALDVARSVFHAQTLANQGRVVDTAGDSVLAVFETAAGALNAALQIQAELAEVYNDIPLESRMQFRIGIHSGDVMEKADGSVYGDGVNIAARLQALAEPGQITVSDAIHGAVRGKVSASFIDQGEQQVKNIEHPIRAYQVQVGEKADPTASAAKPPAGEIDLSLPDKPSIAVLPFTNMSGDTEQEYFTDGITEDIITELSRFHSLFVIARNSSFTYKGKAVDVRTVSKELGVRYVLEGSIRRSGSRIRVTAQLIDAITGNHIWAEKYDRVLEDVFAVQDDLTGSIVAAIAPQIDVAEREKTHRRRPESFSAYEIAVGALAKVIQGLAKSDRALHDEAVNEAKVALTIDARSTVALHAMALAHLQTTMLGSAPERAVAWSAGMAAATRAIEVDPGGSVGYACRGMLLIYAKDKDRMADALTDLRFAQELNPHDMPTLHRLAFCEVSAGDPERAIELSRKALRISPRDPAQFIFHHVIAMSCLCLGRYVEGIENSLRAIHAAPSASGLHANLALLYVGSGDIAKAKAAVEEERRLGMASAMVDRGLAGGMAYRMPGHLLRATTFMRIAAGLEDPSAADALR